MKPLRQNVIADEVIPVVVVSVDISGSDGLSPLEGGFSSAFPRASLFQNGYSNQEAVVYFSDCA